jgi:hypothetical protein
MHRPTGTDEGEDVPGRRLERYIKERWTRQQGGMRGLAAKIGASSETVHSWFRVDGPEPSMAHLRAVADALGVRRSVLVAVLDGDPLPGESNDPELTDRLVAVEATVKLLTRQSNATAEALDALRHSTGSGR